MDGIFKKLGIYDFMGIWASGVLFCIYCSVSFDAFISQIKINSSLSELWFGILFYIGIAYIIGILFHEIGKWVADKLTCFFDFDKYSTIEGLKLKNNKCKHFFTPRNLQYQYRKILQDCGAIPSVKFDRAISELKYTNEVNCQRINTYHSVYGLSRGLFIAVITHLILCFIAILSETKNIGWYTVADVILAYLLFCRTVRYYVSWVANVFIQYKISVKNGLIKGENK